MRMRGKLKIAAGVLLLFLLASLLSVWSYGRFARSAQGQPSQVLPVAGASTDIDALVEPLLAAYPGHAGLSLVADNRDAFAIRAFSARHAGRSLDAMYYIWHDDMTGGLLDAELLAAADRGVRVRLLLDDMTAHGSSQKRLAALDAHPSIEVRLFNPTRERANPLTRGLDLLLRSWSVNRRMHNKAWIVDNRIAVVGGRNVGDEYFDAAEETNFLDADVALIGPPVAETSAIFDEFWNDAAALPIAALVRHGDKALADLRLRMRASADTPQALRWREHLEAAHDLDALLRRRAQLHWADADDVHVHSDPASKVRGEQPQRWMLPILAAYLTEARRSLQVVSPYFVPGEGGLLLVWALRARGAEVDIITNSLAANDVVAVHSGYAPYREPLLQAGARLFELKPHGASDSSLFGSSGASLHTKAFVVDDVLGFIGSFNMDPRSARLNTEMGVVFRHPGAVAELQALVASKLVGEASYEVVLTSDGALRWRDGTAQPPRDWAREPETGWWLRTVSRMIGWLPIESQL
ncbi:MAG: phospholipase D family protein [Pseudoxanthomonas suwonensis]|nr:phospholipase D family protein [Pseudoxanthomonas suwonensis]